MKTLAALTLAIGCAVTGTALHITSTPCPTEDSTLCFWDGSTRGNQTGVSYVALTETIIIHTSKD